MAASRSLDCDFYDSRFGVTGAIGDRERVAGGVGGRNAYATRVGWPDGIRLRLERDGLRVGHAITELRTLSLVNRSRVSVEALDAELFSAELLDGQTIIFEALLGFLLRV